ncbi:MAG TPA: PfkB family carbohydrate kinase [Gaiella sp.]|jgi:sugar/nucleoside kinase (ribokinase family)
MSRIAVVGNLSIDRVAGGEPRAGGGVFWAARAAAHVGADVAVATRCARSDRDVALAPLEALGVPVVCGNARATTAFSFHYEGDHRVMTVDAVGDPWSPVDVEGWAAPALDGAEWALVAGLLRTDFPAETVTALASGGRRLLVDGQGLVRLGRTGSLATDAEVDRAAFSALAVLSLNEQEAEALAGGLEPERLRTLGVPEVVLTLGSRGAVVVTAGASAVIEPHRVDGDVDPTGAGDSFSLLYVEARAAGAEPAEAGERAARVVAELIARP